ncbi:hypothetical protein [Streptomyces abikoensis]|uniref:Uncharacterized protein n=1 Tax=Streptomyces abikoensis TaxID=97398 RepID=A0ABW7T4X4_9ACTN
MGIAGGEWGNGWSQADGRARMLRAWFDRRRFGPTPELRDAHAREHPELWRRQRREQAVLALAVVHASRDQGLAVDDVMLDDITEACRRISPDEYHEHTRKVARRGGISWGQDDRDPADVPDAVAALLDAAAEGLCGGTRRSLGYAIRALRADPKGFGHPHHGGWAIGVRTAQWTLGVARKTISDGRWAISHTDREAARSTGLCQDPVYDYPAHPGPGDPAHPSWLQRAHRLTSLGATLRSLAETLPRDPQGFDGHLASVFNAFIGVCAELDLTVEELDRLWAVADGHLGIGPWEQEHVPQAVLEQTTGAEKALEGLAHFLRGSVIDSPGTH